MAFIYPVSRWESKGVLRVEWELTSLFLPTTSGSAFPIGGIYLPDKSVSVGGDLGGAMVITIQGSNASSATVSTTWGTLHDAQGNNLTIAATGTIETILENPRWIRPHASAATGAVVTVVLVAYGSR